MAGPFHRGQATKPLRKILLFRKCGGGKSAVLVVEGGTQKGTSIKHLSANGRDEDEVLIPSSAKYEITDIFDGDTVYVYLKEVS